MKNERVRNGIRLDYFELLNGGKRLNTQRSKISKNGSKEIDERKNDTANE